MTSKSDPRDSLRKAKRIVLKIGSSVLTRHGSALAKPFFEQLSAELATLQKAGKQFIIVSSGAVAAGRPLFKFTNQDLSIPQKQAAASVGQSRLIQAYEQSFSQYGITIAQILLTHSDLSDRLRYLNARHTLSTLLQNDILPVINENDSVIADEIKFGDNDTLAALITPLVDADLLVLLTDQDGLYDADPKKNKGAKLIPLVTEIDAQIEKAASLDGGPLGRGGMSTKVAAAKRAASYGIPTIIANGHQTTVVSKILAGDGLGTFFVPAEDRLSNRKHWIAHTLKPKGELVLDEGAKKALVEKNKSLLPSGVLAISGNFQVGDAVKLKTQHGEAFAQGIVSYGAPEMQKIIGKKTSEIETILGYKVTDEVIHRDDLVLLKK